MITLIRPFFYSNVYLGICAVALCIETNLLNHLSLNIFPFYLLIFFCTVMYYTRIYVRSVRTKHFDDRTLWYRNHLSSIKITLKAFIAVTAVLLLTLLIKNLSAFFLLTPAQLFLMIAFPFIPASYTFAPKIFGLTKMRQAGWIKPFIVGLTWAGWVTIYPLCIWQVQRGQLFDLRLLPALLLLLQDFLFFSINAIIFDIKDYRTDRQHKLKTYPVVLGIRNTFRFVVFPLIVVNLVVFFIYQWQQNFSFLQTSIQLIPYLLLIFIILSYRHGRSVLYYLAAVDGLVFLKALCGITSILLIKN